MTDSRFIRMLWVYVGLTLVTFPFAFFPGYSDALAAAYAEEQEAWLFRNGWLVASVAIPMLLAWLAGLIGLFFFKRWARTLSLCLTILGLVFGASLGPYLQSGPETALWEAGAMLWGAILALSYFSPVSARFER